MKAVKNTFKRKWYQESFSHHDLSLLTSNNSSYVQSGGNFYANFNGQSTTQTYTFHTPVFAKDITLSISYSSQSNSQIQGCKVTANDGSVTLRDGGFGRGASGTYKNTHYFDDFTPIKNITIYYYGARLGNLNHYSSASMYFTVTTKVTEEASQEPIVNYLAEGYKERSYIYGTSQLDLGYYPTDSTKIQSKFMYTNYAGHSLIGHQTDSETDSFRFFRGDDTTYLDYGSGYQYNRIQGSFITSTSDIYEVEFGNRYVKNLATDTTVFSGTSVTFDTKSYTIKVFNTSDLGDNGILYYLKIFEGDNLMLDLVPCEREVDGVVGLYDKINDVFYASDNWVAPADYYKDIPVYKVVKGETVREYYKYLDTPDVLVDLYASNTQRLIESATETDYDFYKDVDVYKAIKSYTKGRYYGN